MLEHIVSCGVTSNDAIVTTWQGIYSWTATDVLGHDVGTELFAFPLRLTVFAPWNLTYTRIVWG
jgi:hypothetical protein